MQKKENEVSSDALAKKGACKLGIEEFKKWYPSGSAPLSEVLRELQILANTALNPLKYVDYARWLFDNFPPTQKPLVLDELTDKFIFHNGDLTIKKGVGDSIIIDNGDLNIEDDVNLTGWVEIQAKNVKGQNITLYDFAGISAAETIKAINIWAYSSAGIDAKTIDATNIAAYGYSGISAEETIKAINIAAYDDAGIRAKKINVQDITDESYKGIRGEINIIQPSSNPQNVTQPAK